MLNLVVFLLIFLVFCLLAKLVLKQYPSTKSSRKTTSTPRKHPLSKETQSIVTGIGLLLIFLINISSNGFMPPAYQMPDNSSKPVLYDNGPTSDGTTKITVMSAVPRPFVFAITQKQQKQDFELASCEKCKLYANSSEVPKNVCELGNAKTIDVPPGENKVYWYYKNIRINPISATWDI